MGRWIEQKSNWLHNCGTPRPREKPRGRPTDENLEYGVRFIPVKCPKCKSKNITCYASRLPIRYHKCRDCETCFKSVEESEK